jgi:succinate-semialdehyde dehydrogenase / glutarate-semialdehyde dehydrogenase
MTILNQSLLRDRAYVGGEWVDALSRERFEVRNPATNELVGTVPHMAPDDVEHAIASANRAFAGWSACSAKERAEPLKEWARLIVQNAVELAAILTSEQGKPLVDAKNEVLFAASFVEWFAEEARRTYGETIPAARRNMSFTTVKEPIGVAAGITPWNLPCAMVTRKAAPALAAGCTMVLKPAEHTPLSALALCALAERAGIPPGVFNVVTANRSAADAIGRTVTSSESIGKLSFTGSTSVGKILSAQCAATMKRVSLELGGNSPFIVFADADLDVAVSSALFAKFRNAGQTCIAPNRFLIEASVHDEFVARMLKAMKSLKLGDGMNADVTLGPVISEEAVRKIERHIENALELGALLFAGGKRAQRDGYFFEPTLMTGITEEMAMSCEETFGPVMGLSTFKNERELIERANATRMGLASYLFSRDASRIHRVSSRLEAGIVGINTGMIATEVAPFGGYKESGIGREGAREGIDEFMETKFLCQAFSA